MGVSAEGERSERRAGRRSSQQRVRIVVLAVVLVLAVGLVWWFAFRSSGQAGEPLAGGPGGSVGVGATPGAPVSIGLVGLQNRGKSDVVIDRVSLLDPTTGLRLVGMYAPPEGKDVVGAANGFRWPRGAVEVEGLTIKPSGTPGDSLVLGLQVDAEGVFRSSGVQIEYHAGDRRYVKVYELGIELCAPVRLYKARCT
jgi:hypothetical protein